jgi:hypothetical protein
MGPEGARQIIQRLMQRVFWDRTNMAMIVMALLILFFGSYAIAG